MIAELIIFILVTVIWCLGWYVITRENMILAFVDEYFDGKYFGKAIVNCITCLASFHGTLVFIVLCYFGELSFNIITWIIGIVSASFIQTLLWQFYSYLSAKTNYYQMKLQNEL